MTTNASHPHTKRNQAIYTPIKVIDCVLGVWAGIIDYDPFPGDLAPITDLALACAKDGFEDTWRPYAFANPPFDRLKEAMSRAAHFGHTCRQETMLLSPTRSHREWWWSCRDSASVVAHLKPLAFHGHKSTFPFPLTVMYWGELPSAFQRAFEPISYKIEVL